MDRSSFLPTIKCSNCAVDIDISHLADHVCDATPPPPPPKSYEPASPKLDRAATFGGASMNNKFEAKRRSGRMPAPPRIDPNAANKPFRPQEASPLSDYSAMNSRSPLSPRGGRMPFQMNRSATSPMPRPFGPPSPDLMLNMDSAYPTFPTGRSGTPTSARSKPRERLEPTYTQRYAEPSPLYAPLSPRTNGGERIAKRMDSIAPGPFDGREDRRPSTSSGPGTPAGGSSFGHRRTATQSSTRSNGYAANQRTSMASNASRGSNYSVGLPSRPKPGMGGVDVMPPPPRPPVQTEGIDAFLDRLQKETMEPSKIAQDSRSKTFPMRQESKDAMNPPPRPRRPSESNSLSRRPTNGGAFNSTNMFPSRSSSRGGSKAGMGRDDLAPPPPPVPTYAKELPPNPLHTPSDSGLSDDSYTSSGFRSAASSRSSPPTSEASHSRQASKAARSDYGEEFIPRTASPEPIAEVRPPPPQNRDQRDPGSYDRGRAPGPALQPPQMTFSDVPESPLDPAIQRGISAERRPAESRPLQDPALNLGRSPPRREPRRRELSPEPPRSVSRRPTGANKGRCRGCSDQIIGKSVKDSSGRLTGRYHKNCFVCRTCADPFPSADFYVFNNFPYCEQHYHELNGSLCSNCDRGIEGQYLETDVRQKYHPRCFSCSTCRIVLRDDYYEVGGRNYCERHAYHVANQQKNLLGPGGNQSRNLQKRRTRLMMMV